MYDLDHDEGHFVENHSINAINVEAEINRTSNGGIDFSLQSSELYSCIQIKIRKEWFVDFAKL